MKGYPLIIEWSDEDNLYVVTSPLFPGFSALGETQEQALAEGRIALELFIESYQDRGIPLPEPQSAQRYSGQTRLRLSKSLHRQAAAMAELEGVSLNTYIADAVTARLTGEQIARPLIEELKRQFAITQVASVLTVKPIAQYSKKITKEMVTMEHVVSLPVHERKRGN